jgi:cytochrome c-type biogenesis protein CcmH/NrfF
MPREFLEVLAWVIPIVVVVAVVAIVWIRVKRRGPFPGPYKKGIHIRRND